MKIKINDFSISVKLSTILIFVLMIALGYIEQFFILYMFIVIHEIIHIFAAYCFGVKCSGIVIMPIGLCAKIEGIENVRLYKRNIVILSAPLFNIAVGLLFNNTYIGYGNLLIGIFNMLPIYPLDGARLFQNVVGYFRGTLKANKYLIVMGNVLVIMLFTGGIIQLVLFSFNFTLIIIAMYIYKESKGVKINRAYYFYKCLIRNKSEKRRKIKLIKVNEGIDLKEILYKFGVDYYTMIYVGGKMIDEDTIRNYIGKYGINFTLAEILKE